MRKIDKKINREQNMDYVANFIEQNKDIAKTILNILHAQFNYLSDYENLNIATQIRKITDRDCVRLLTTRCYEINYVNEDKNNWKRSLHNIAKIQTYMKLKTKHEIDMLNTLHNIDWTSKDDEYLCKKTLSYVQFVLNGCNCEIVIENGISYKNDVITSYTIDSNRMDKNEKLDKSYANHAFQSMMTFDEYETFLNRLMQIIMIHRFELSSDCYVPHYTPTVNIANLLLCAMNEQEQCDKTLTYSTMSFVEKVLYDEFLLKCITEKS